MEYEWDAAKRRRNLAIHGVDFSAIECFEWESAIVDEDRRGDYSETRYSALGLINGRVHSLVFTLRDGNYRIISLRKANRREVRKWRQK
ncbi:MAG: BrnT family toxin [Chthoniobacterales bacterium]